LPIRGKNLFSQTEVRQSNHWLATTISVNTPTNPMEPEGMAAGLKYIELA
jgi:hypothetical protein